MVNSLGASGSQAMRNPERQWCVCVCVCVSVVCAPVSVCVSVRMCFLQTRITSVANTKKHLLTCTDCRQD